MSHRKSGFTLIELLVVIAIIAILAAILFPVFARAREAARKTTCLSNVKQLSLAHLMYAQDYDEQLATSWSYGFPGEFSWAVQPYMKNLNILLCPDRTTSAAAMASGCNNNNMLPGHIDNPTGSPTAWGYGFNTGLMWNDNTGATMQGTAVWGGNGPTVTININGVACLVQLRDPPMVGRPLAAFAAPASCMFLADTADGIVQGLGLGDIHDLSFDNPNDTCAQVRKQNWPRHNGTNNAAYVDGHSKNYRYDLTPVVVYGSGGQNKVMPNLCNYMYDYDGGNNPHDCNLSLGTGITVAD